MGTTLQQPSFSAGELTPSLWARADMEMYRTGLKKCQNFIVNYHGGIVNRAGFKYIGPAKTSANNTVLIPFEFSSQQTFMLEFTPGIIRIIYRGAFVTGDDGSIIEVSTPYTNDEILRLTYTQSADVLTLFHNNHKIRQFKRYSNTDWQLEEFENSGGPFEEYNVDDSKTVYSNAPTGTVTLTSNFDMFESDHVGKLLSLEQQTSGEIPSWIQRMPVSFDDGAYYAGNYYKCTEANEYKDNPAQTGDNPPVHEEGEEWDGPNKYLPDDNRDAIIGVKWQYLHSGFGIVRIDSVETARSATGTVIGYLPETMIGGSKAKQEWEFKDQTTEKVFTLDPAPTSDNIVDFSVKLVRGSSETPLNYPQDYSINFEDNELILVNPPGTGQDNTTARDVVCTQKASVRETYKWAFEPWRETTKYPQCGTYYQQRFSMASTQDLPQTLWMSRTDSFSDFSTSRPILADDSMRFDVNSLQVNEILHMAPLNALLLFTSGGVWSINQGSNDVITPESPPSVRIQSYAGSSPLRPIIVGSTGLYVQAGGQYVRDINFDFSSDAYIGSDLTVRATHLFHGKTITSWCYAENPHRAIFVSFSDGTFAIFTYMKEQQVWGWASGKTDGFVRYFASIMEDNNDVVYSVVQREGINMIERMENRYFNDEYDQFFVDSGLTYDGRNKDTDASITITADEYEFPYVATLVATKDVFTQDDVGKAFSFKDDTGKARVTIETVTDARNATAIIEEVVPESMRGVMTNGWGRAVDTVTGLDHLERKTVSLLGDGSDIAPQVVDSGSVDLGGFYTVVHAGLGYESVAVTLDLELTNPPETARTRKKVINKVSAMVRDTMQIKAGAGKEIYEQKCRFDEPYGYAPTAKTGLVQVDVSSKWDYSGSVTILQDRPIATEILSIMPEVSISES